MSDLATDSATPQCRHFGVCGGCQYQDVVYGAQLALKRETLLGVLDRASVAASVEVNVFGSPVSYGYRNRIRLRLVRVDATPRVGYSIRGSNDFLPIVECPIAAPLLWNVAAEFMRLAAEDATAARWFDASDEAEFFCDAEEQRVQITLLTARRERSLKKESSSSNIEDLLHKLQATVPQLSGVAQAQVDARSGRVLRIVEESGTAGLLYRVADEAYWVSPGGFFQVNRALLPKLVDLVCGNRSGEIAWDLFAGVGLFSRVLAQKFKSVTAVEVSPNAAPGLKASLSKLGSQHRAVQATTEEFLRKAALDRERPQLIVLDPPRAGLGTEVCALLPRFAATEVVYVSCDPNTLASDLAKLTASAYTISEIHLVDLFPQTAHMETVVVLHRV